MFITNNYLVVTRYRKPARSPQNRQDSSTSEIIDFEQSLFTLVHSFDDHEKTAHTISSLVNLEKWNYVVVGMSAGPGSDVFRRIVVAADHCAAWRFLLETVRVGDSVISWSGSLQRQQTADVV